MATIDEHSLAQRLLTNHAHVRRLHAAKRYQLLSSKTGSKAVKDVEATARIVESGLANANYLILCTNIYLVYKQQSQDRCLRSKNSTAIRDVEP